MSTYSTATATQLKSADIATAMIQGHPDLKGIFLANEGSAIGVINAIQRRAWQASSS